MYPKGLSEAVFGFIYCISSLLYPRLPGPSVVRPLLFALPLLHHRMCVVDAETKKRSREDHAVGS